MNLIYSKKKIIIGFVFLGLAGPLFFYLVKGGFSFSREVQILNSFGFGGNVINDFSYIKKIDSGFEILKNSAPLKSRSDRYGNLIEKEIAFAVFDTETGEVFEKRGWINESQAQNYRQTGIMNIAMESAGPDINIQPNWFNSFNSDYRIVDHPEMVVVANKYLVPSSYLPPSLRSGKAYSDITYAPYSGGLHVPEVIKEGIDYLNQKTEIAFNELESLGVKSRAEPTRLVTELVSPDLVKNILVVEHIDPDAFNNASNERKKELAERVLVIIGANKGLAYGLTGSHAGANGIAQFIRPTYDYISSLYPKAKLIQNYQLGTMDHDNIIKAQVLFFDRHKESLANSISRKDLVNALGISDEMLAASYNGGPSRVVQSVNKYGLAWINLQLNSTSVAQIFRQETIDYIKKFQFVRGERVFE